MPVSLEGDGTFGSVSKTTAEVTNPAARDISKISGTRGRVNPSFGGSKNARVRPSAVTGARLKTRH